MITKSFGSFGKEKRLRKQKEISALFHGSSRLSFGGLTMRYKKNGLDTDRIAIANGRRFGSAVERNRVRRVIREVFRTHSRIGIGTSGHVDIVFTQYKILKDVPKTEIAERVRHLFDQIA